MCNSSFPPTSGDEWIEVLDSWLPVREFSLEFDKLAPAGVRLFQLGPLRAHEKLRHCWQLGAFECPAKTNNTSLRYNAALAPTPPTTSTTTISPSNLLPYFDFDVPRNLTVTVGQTGFLHCRVERLGDKDQAA
uniref:HDC07556 n=1 Tax=Drosophila melanogaster TaxID=7227 RepID=Q6IM38_DROME|nr:TPA_inf: HDC07556 [Drosophila melanogaster]